MTPGARLQSAIEILDRILARQPAEQALTNWARGHRFAGSKDRAAIRDHVFDCIRCKRSFAHLGGRTDGRGLVLGLLRDAGTDPETLFTGEGYGPRKLAQDDMPDPAPMPRAVALDCPDWLLPELDRSLGANTDQVLLAMRHRAPVFLRVNEARATREQAAALLAADGIETRPVPLANTALEVTAQARRVRQSAAFADGLIELQDAASQAVIAALPDISGAKVLDYCAGGGGKALAMAARGADVTAHDADAARMKDLPERAARAGVQIACCARPEGVFDLVLADVPCSGSGAWRRAPEGKWALTPDRLAQLRTLQQEILAKAWAHVRPGGCLAYATCSLLDVENDLAVACFATTIGGRSPSNTLNLTPLDGGDGFFGSLIHKAI
ncbi:Ribosomal RNA small subunit methyltransferase B [Roseibaca ekhonensis]|jgi:16S rRNA (cytosine967-C5)-methyltransferase|uniref:Ribosomal RNA small subunit methyltransferase B n=1 Tax=Roseinatronobacter ekhonensis TaxID=254356 RepID=A0A3B0N038_9RHOB|nr:RsmB/NOP family class I SAM-dependent RNA methyltransferase [Roseibaca ekhonensis]SUZ33406.1 Ribosomal RNA small subunit methyltransferase B [Roseibaca ekhonensis]